MSPCTTFLYTRITFNSMIASFVFSYRCITAFFRSSSAFSASFPTTVFALCSAASFSSPACSRSLGRKAPACARSGYTLAQGEDWFCVCSVLHSIVSLLAGCIDSCW